MHLKGKYILSELDNGRKSFFSFSIPKKSILRSIPRVCSELYKLQEASQNEETQNFLEEIIIKVISRNKTETVDALVELIRDSQYKEIRWEAIDALGEIGEGNKIAIDVLVELINSSEEANIRWKAVDNLIKIDSINPIIIETLIDLINVRQRLFLRFSLFMRLEKFGYGNPKAIEALLNLIQNANNDYDTNAAKSLHKILTSEYMVRVIIALKEVLSKKADTNNVGRYKDCLKIIWKCTQNMKYPEFYQAWHQQNNSTIQTYQNSYQT